MGILIFLIGLLIGRPLKVIIDKISCNLSLNEDRPLFQNKVIRLDFIRTILKEAYHVNFFKLLEWVGVISGFVFLTSFLRLGFTVIFLKVSILSLVLIIVSFIDFKHQIIPDEFVVFILILGILFMIIEGQPSLMSGVLGMFAGGGILFIMALIPGAMGGGDIKLMFSLGIFLGFYKTLWTLLFAFIIAAIASLLLLSLRIKGRKDHIPFGPFLALGCFMSLLIFI